MPGKKQTKKIVRVRDVTGLMRVRVRQRAFGELLSSDSEDSDYDPGFLLESESDSSSSSTSVMEDSETEEEGASPKPSTSRKRRKTSKQPAKKQKRNPSPKPKPKPKKSKPKRNASSGRTSDRAEASTSRAGTSSSDPGEKLPVIIMRDCKVPTLPSEILLKIFKFAVRSVGITFLCRAARVCSQWHQVSADPVLWRKVDLSHGRVKATEATLRCLADHRLAGCQELSLASWANLKSEWLQYLAERCPNLRVVNVNNCKKISSAGISSLVDHCPQLSVLNIAFTNTDCVSTNCIKHLVETRGRQLTHLEFGGNSMSNFMGVLNLIMAQCPNLEVVDMSNLWLGGTRLVPVERMHRSWPRLQIFRASNVSISGSYTSQHERDSSPGFPLLQEISLASRSYDSLSNYLQVAVSPSLLSGLCKNATKLRLLDLRGCSTLRTSDLACVCAEALEQVHLSRLELSYDSTLQQLLSKHLHSMVELDVSGMLGDKLLSAVAVLGKGCPELELLDLSFTHLDEDTLKIVLKGTPKLRNLNLESCRSLPRGIKRRYHSAEEIKRLLKKLGI